MPVASGHLPEQAQESEPNVYAIVRAGGRQEKVSVGDVLIIDKVRGEAGDSIELTPLLLVDGPTVTTDASTLAKVTLRRPEASRARFQTTPAQFYPAPRSRSLPRWSSPPRAPRSRS